MNIQAIANDLKQGYYANNPVKCANDKGIVSGELSFIYVQLEALSVARARWFNTNRDKYKSDTACHRAFEVTEDGINLNGLEYREKACKSIITALNSLIKIAEGQALNNY